MSKKYTPEQIRLLLSLYKSKQTKTAITKRYWKLSADLREQLIKELIDDDLIYSERCPTPDSRKTPTYYFISLQGQKWVKSYLQHIQGD